MEFPTLLVNKIRRQKTTDAEALEKGKKRYGCSHFLAPGFLQDISHQRLRNPAPERSEKRLGPHLLFMGARVQHFTQPLTVL